LEIIWGDYFDQLPKVNISIHCYKKKLPFCVE